MNTYNAHCFYYDADDNRIRFDATYDNDKSFLQNCVELTGYANLEAIQKADHVLSEAIRKAYNEVEDNKRYAQKYWLEDHGYNDVMELITSGNLQGFQEMNAHVNESTLDETHYWFEAFMYTCKKHDLI